MTTIDITHEDIGRQRDFLSICSKVIQVLDAWRARRRRLLALGELMQFDAARLDDIGITLQDIEDMISSPDKARAIGRP